MFETKMAMWLSVLKSLKDGSEFFCTPEMAMSHIELVEKLHVENEIRDIPKSELARVTQNGDEHIYIPNLNKELKRCLNEEALPSELGYAWAI